MNIRYHSCTMMFISREMPECTVILCLRFIQLHFSLCFFKSENLREAKKTLSMSISIEIVIIVIHSLTMPKITLPMKVHSAKKKKTY